jgi:deoxyribodipyrimidine photolyase-related protein
VAVLSTLLLYPHQLFAADLLPEAHRVVLIEEPLLFGTDRSYPLDMHKQKLMLHRASMRRYARAVLAGMYGEVVYLSVGDIEATEDAVEVACAGSASVTIFDPCDDVLHQRIVGAVASFPEVRFSELPSPNWLLTNTDIADEFPKSRTPRMTDFYRRQRRRMRLLVDDEGHPEGGRWSFDADNRKKLPRDYAAPTFRRFGSDPEVTRAREWVEARFVANPGQTDDFWWPTNHSEAQAWLSDFLENRLDEFGPYEDALEGQESLLQHSGLSVPLNMGLLTPDQIVVQAMQRHRDRPVPLASLEGFLRQIIGWREYVRGVYVTSGARQRTTNALRQSRPLPEIWWEGESGLPPLDDALEKLRGSGYAHHIERLMVMGNLMLLCRTDPDEVYRWFMAHFVDAYDWVMVPNVYGMSQFADGGLMTSKPYVAGSNYLRKMSHYSAGDWCDVWDGLYWSFVADHRDLFAANPRTSMMVRALDRLNHERADRIRTASQAWLAEHHG